MILSSELFIIVWFNSFTILFLFIPTIYFVKEAPENQSFNQSSNSSILFAQNKGNIIAQLIARRGAFRDNLVLFNFPRCMHGFKILPLIKIAVYISLYLMHNLLCLLLKTVFVYFSGYQLFLLMITFNHDLFV